MNRRHLFAFLALALAGCTPTGKPDIAQATADANAVYNGVSQGYAAIRTLYPSAVSPATDAQVQTILSAAPGYLVELSKAADAATQAADLRGVGRLAEDVLNIAAAIVAKIPGVPPEVTTGLVLAQVLVPVLEATANQLVPVAGARAAGPAVFRSNVSVAEARVRLRR